MSDLVAASSATLDTTPKPIPGPLSQTTVLYPLEDSVIGEGEPPVDAENPIVKENQVLQRENERLKKLLASKDTTIASLESRQACEISNALTNIHDKNLESLQVHTTAISDSLCGAINADIEKIVGTNC